MAYTTIDDPSAHFQTATYTGNAGALNIVNGGNSDSQPDLVWRKDRGATKSHRLVDSSRGVQEAIRSNADSAEGTDTGLVTAFNSDGFSHNSTDTAWNGSGDTYVAWQWKANGGTRTTNTESGNNPAGGYQANTTAGFSIVDYTGTGAAGTMAHGLGAVPTCMIIKNRGESVDWGVYHQEMSSAGNDSYLELNTNDATATAGTMWNDTTPTSSVFTIGSNTKTNKDAIAYIAYVFTPIQGFSKFGSYTGNGNADGVFVYTGFKPAWVMQKRTNNSTDAHWHIFDVKRNTYNPRNTRLEGNNNFADSTGEGADFLSNGFKWRSNDVRYNGSDDTYIYMAFAEHPFVSSEGVPCTAR